MNRRTFVQRGVACAAVAGLTDFGFLSKLGSVSAAETALKPGMVQLHREIEPLVRLLETTPRDKVIEEVASRIRHGLTYREVLARYCWQAFAISDRIRLALNFTRCW